MTNPFAFQNGGVIPGAGDGAGMAQGLAGVLAQIQQQRENQYRMQELQTQQAQQQALQQYYQGQNQNQAAEQTRLTNQWQAGQQANAQVGSAQRAALGQDPNAGLFHQVLAGGAQAMPPGISSVFTGVSDANMPAAVKGVQEVQELQPKTPELPTAAKEFEFMQHLSQIDPSGVAPKFFYDNWVKKQPGVVVNTGQKSETAFGVEIAKGDVGAQEEAVKAANQAASSFPSMAEGYGLIDRSLTGFGSKQVLALARIAGAAGFKPSKDLAADTQTLSKLLRDGVLAQLQTRALGSGTAVSDADRNYMEQVQGADLTQEPGAIKRIIRINVGLGIEKMVSAKMLLEQQVQDHPESAGVLNGKIAMIDKKFKPIWAQYQKMLTDEVKSESQARLTVGPTGDAMFPQR